MTYYTADSSNISFLYPTGNAVVRSLQTKLTDQVFVADFGADSTGTNDSTAAFNNAISYAGSRVIFVAGGTYLLNGTVTPAVGTNFRFDDGVTFTGGGSIALGNSNNIYEQRNTSAVATTQMRVQKQFSQGADLQNLAYLWSTSTASYVGISKQFNSGYTGSPTGSPYSALATWATDNSSGADVVSVLGVTEVLGNNGIGFGANFIATNAAATTLTKLVGCEIDLEPTSGTTVGAGSAGLYINAFNVGSIGPAMQVGGVSGGTFNNGFIINGIAAAGTAVAAQSGLSCTNFINTASGGFSGAAIQLGNSQGLGWTAGAAINGDSGGNLNLNPSAAVVVSGTNTTEGNSLMVVRDSGSVAALQVFVARGSAANAANAAIKVNGQSVTSRSINAGGTINASGTDYAEYETKRDDCGVLEKGQIVGFDHEGKLTDRFSLAVSFGIKSTSPSIVGGDVWHAEAGIEPLSPKHPGSLRPAPELHAGHSRYHHHKESVDAAHAEALAVWESEKLEHEKATESYEKDLQVYEAAHTEWEMAHENSRSKVDRIAYCGKVPVNVRGAIVGQYVIPFPSVNDEIVGIAIHEISVSFREYIRAVGRVRRVLEDGRAEVTVKPI